MVEQHRHMMFLQRGDRKDPCSWACVEVLDIPCAQEHMGRLLSVMCTGHSPTSLLACFRSLLLSMFRAALALHTGYGVARGGLGNYVCACKVEAPLCCISIPARVLWCALVVGGLF
jgi:hypothetical protein